MLIHMSYQLYFNNTPPSFKVITKIFVPKLSVLLCVNYHHIYKKKLCRSRRRNIYIGGETLMSLKIDHLYKKRQVQTQHIVY